MFASKDTLLTRPSGGYNIARSVRTRKSASAYFNRTPASAGNRTTWTWSSWIKRGLITTDSIFFGAFTTSGSGTNAGYFRFNSTDNLWFFIDSGGSGAASLVTTQVFRDPSAWYHIIIVFDSTQATSSNRIKMYVNGVQITSFSTATYPTQNFSGFINNNVIHRIGVDDAGGNLYFDGYLTEVNFIDGQALTPSSFGETDSITGVWKPKAYSGSYGTNGFELNFSDNSNNTAATIGKDYSGNGNNWTPNNISVTAGATYDSMQDVPTLTSATAANYAVLNPLAGVTSGRSMTNGNLDVATTASKATSPATIAISSGKWYWEVTCGSTNNLAVYEFGIVSTSVNIVESLDSMTGGSYAYYGFNGNKYSNTTGSAYGATFTNGDVIGHALDLDSGTLTFYKNNTSQGTAFTGLSGTFYQAACAGSTGSNINFTANFGQRPFTYTPPTGFVALNTYNLPASTITNGAAYMAATTYTGTGASLTVANTVGSTSFKPDFVWIKSRSAATDNKLTDSLRGVTKAFISNLADGETTDTQGLTAFNSNGFTVGTNTIYNNSSATYVAWQWQAGQGSSASNTSGSITSTVSKNTTAGFSIVTYSGNSTSGATIGHGLGITPDLIIVKRLNATLAQSPNAIVYVTPLGNTKGLILDGTYSAQTASGFWNNTSPTSSVFSVGNDANTNVTSFNYVAYCFSAVAGYSAFGSYTGNGSTDGPFVYTGFRPRFILFKRTDTTADWRIEDTSRSPTNATQIEIYPNLSNAEGSAPDGMDILSNGFKFRGSYAQWNASGGTFIFAAFAENPFRNALAR